jgi:hypothetical protein
MFGSLRELATVPLAELLKIKGVGKATACAIQAAMHLGRRLQQCFRTSCRQPPDAPPSRSFPFLHPTGSPCFDTACGDAVTGRYKSKRFDLSRTYTSLHNHTHVITFHASRITFHFCFQLFSLTRDVPGSA